VVIKNEALNKKYPEGFKAFATEHGARCNDDITVYCDMGGDVNLIVSQLKELGLEYHKDYCVFDAAGEAIALTMGNQKVENIIPIDLGVEWLGAHFNPDTGVEVWYSKKPDAEEVTESFPEIDFDYYRRKCRELDNLLVYGDLNENLVFIEMEPALTNAKIHDALQKEMSFWEFWNTYPNSCKQVIERLCDIRELYQIEFPSETKLNPEELFSLFFNSWYENSAYEWEEEAKKDFNLDLKNRTQAELFYRDHLYESDRLPLPDETFCILEEESFYDWLWFPHRMTDWVPSEIESKFGDVIYGMVCGDYLQLDIAKEKEIVDEFNRLGYNCIRDDHLIAKAAGL
jgi:hypothetical protein